MTVEEAIVQIGREKKGFQNVRDKALENLEYRASEYTQYVVDECEKKITAFEMAVEALGKQIPKKAAYDARCPVCGKLLFVEGRVLLPVCPCGQKIDWSERE